MEPDLADDLGVEETSTLEFKRSTENRDAVRKAICALANDLPGKGGGDVLIGVDKHGQPVDKVDTSDNKLNEITNYRDGGQILDRPSMTVEKAAYRGKPVVRVRVNASASTPVRFDGVVYVRPGPSTRKASPEDERILTERRRALDLPFDSRPVPSATTKDLDLTAFRSTYLPSVISPEVLDDNHRPTAQQLASMRMTDPDGTPTVLGVLVIGLDPGAHLPGAYLQFVRYDGVTLDSPITDDQELRENVIDLGARLSAVLQGHLHTRLSAADNFREVATPDYPLDALREICMNAVMHRNYESSYAPVRVVWFEDRIEVSNPGGPYGQVRADNFDRVNDYRNPSLAAAMKSLGYVNRFGRGIGRVQTALARNGNPAAKFDIDDSSWVVTLRRSP